MSDETLPRQTVALPVKTLQVKVIAGPDVEQTARSGDTITIGTAHNNDLVLGDPTVSRYHVELARHPKGVLVVDHGSTNGTYVGDVRLDRAVVPARTTLRLGDSTIAIDDGERKTVELHRDDSLVGLRGSSEAMRRLMAQIHRAAITETSVLVVGESGTGKELIAQALHVLGPRAAGPLVTVDCGVLTPTLVASELFGHERGAFTGADRQHAGAFERAAGGTIFLDEIGELPADLQTQLLGVIERRTFRRLGGRADLRADVRVVSATHRDLRSEVNRGRFRLDLYYRLAVVTLRVPPLRDRIDDIVVLAEHFLREVGIENVGGVLTPTVVKLLESHAWPGNVRELRNVMESMVAMGGAPELDPPTGPPTATGDVFERGLTMSYKDARAAVLAEFESRFLRKLLERTGGNVSRAARLAAMDRTHLIELLQRHNLR